MAAAWTFHPGGMIHSPEGSSPMFVTPGGTPPPVETRAQLAWLDSEGILRARSKPQCDIKLADAEEIIRKIGALVGGTPRPILVDLTDTRSMSREARKYFASPETAKVETAAALLVRSPLAKAIGNFFMGMNKSIIPARLFTSETEALAWLRDFLP
jgi:hypothetical protein